MENDKYAEQVQRALNRQAATIARSELAENTKHCLGQGGSNFTAMAAQLRQTLQAQRLAPALGQGNQGGSSNGNGLDTTR